LAKETRRSLRSLARNYKKVAVNILIFINALFSMKFYNFNIFLSGR